MFVRGLLVESQSAVSKRPIVQITKTTPDSMRIAENALSPPDPLVAWPMPVARYQQPPWASIPIVASTMSMDRPETLLLKNVARSIRTAAAAIPPP